MASSSRRGSEDVTLAERITLAISVLLLVVLVGGLVLLELQRGDEPPRIDVTPRYGEATEHGGDWYLPVTVRNAGDRATGTLLVELVRPSAGEEPEVAQLEWVFVAGGEEVEGTAVFDEEPTAEAIEVDVVSTTEP